MSVLVSKCNSHPAKFSKELFTEISHNVNIVSDEEWESNADKYKRVMFAVYIRTDVDNLVLMVDKDKFAKVCNVPPFVLDGGVYDSLLIDSGLVCGKILLDSVFEFKSQESLKRFIGKSTCYPVGAVETLKNYIAVFNVIISSDLLRDTEVLLKRGFHFNPIETLNVPDSIQKEISESLILVNK